LHEQKREAVPKHSLPPQEQILSYVGRFINCPYGTPENGTEVFRDFAWNGAEKRENLFFLFLFPAKYAIIYI